MFSIRVALALGATILAGSTLSASAADLYGGGLKDGSYVQDVPSGPSGWYLRADGAWASYSVDDIGLLDMGLINAPSTFINNRGSIDSGWSVGGGVGRYLGMGFRGDLTLEYRTSTQVSGSADACCALGTSTDVDGAVGLANLYYDFNRGARIVPYLGAGIGFAHLETKGGTLACTTACGANFGPATYGGESTTNFAVAAMAGFSWRIAGSEPVYYGGGMKDGPVMAASGRALYLDVGYRYLYLGDVEGGTAVQANTNEIKLGWDSLQAHEVRAGLRYDLN